MSEPLDLDALEVEQNQKPYEFTFGGETFVVSAGALDIRISTALRLGDWGRAVEILLGPAEWERLVSSPATFQWEHANALIGGYVAHLGTSVGKSSGSPRSSKSKAKPSKPISKGSTGSNSRS